MTAPNLNQLWADLIVEVLVRNGIDQFCLAPGSRSTPLTTAVAAHPNARSIVHFDERGTSFFALGYGRATRKPAVWITTSGTAVPNGFPTVVEAAQDFVPLLLLTADRPPELLDSGTNQAIDQVKLFEHYVRHFSNLPCPTHKIPPPFVLTTIEQALYQSYFIPGPVHVNLQFREPLAPDHDASVPPQYLIPVQSWLKSGTPYTVYEPSISSPGTRVLDQLAEVCSSAQRGLLVVGRLDTNEEAGAVRLLASKLGWPVLADITSQLRLGSDFPEQIHYYDQLLGHSIFAEQHAPDAVVHLGGAFVSKRLLQFLNRTKPDRYIRVKNTPVRHDPNHQVTQHIQTDILLFCKELQAKINQQNNDPWLYSWRQANSRLDAYLDSLTSTSAHLTEPAVARLVSQHIPDHQGLYLASSMPIRDMDMFAATNGPIVRVGANRGASGIDGTVASAAGFAAGLNTLVTLVIGDLALLHDLNSLSILRSVPVVLVVLNNNGGGIFSFLPIAKHQDLFEPYFGTPFNVSFEHAARMFDLPYSAPSTIPEFISAYVKATETGTSAIIEVKTNREENYQLHQRLLEEALR